MTLPKIMSLWYRSQSLQRRLAFSFFIFGLINNVLYVIVLSAALDLVPPSTPKGIIAFCNIFPALIAKAIWPYLSRGQVRYSRRLIGCASLSATGMTSVAVGSSLSTRLLGISLASFSSGLGELTFLQLSTTYTSPSTAGKSIGYFASGTGAAGLVGAFLWWELRGLGVRFGVGLSALMPVFIPLTYFFLLPLDEAFSEGRRDIGYSRLQTDQEEDHNGTAELESPKGIGLSIENKLEIVRPLLLTFMLPLFFVYLFEYTINQGIAPTLVYPVPSSKDYPIISVIIQSIRDYYPLWQLVYQSTVFLSRSSISLGIPPIPTRFLPLPSIVQGFILSALALESSTGILEQRSFGFTIFTVFLLICLEGICGGLAYVNVFYHVNQQDDGVPSGDLHTQEREFRIGSIGFADSSGILLASIVAIPTEMSLCDAQVRRGKQLCRQL